MKSDSRSVAFHFSLFDNKVCVHLSFGQLCTKFDDHLIFVHPEDMVEMGLEAGQKIKVLSRRGEIEGRVRVVSGMQKGDVFIPFCYVEAAANLLTNEALDPFGKIAEVKYCAVRLEAG